jgi:cell division protein ftsZ
METNPELPDILNSEDFATRNDEAIIKVIGVGGGGGNAVNYMYKQNIPHVNFVVCNTDLQALKMSPVPNRLILGWDVTTGRGAGNEPAVGRQCAEASAEDIRHLFEDNTEMVFITAGMGGGTGTGAAPVVARIAKDAGMLTIGIVTVPFRFEGEKKILKALDGANEMKKHVDALLVINNENLIDLYKDLNFFNAFGKADDTLANAARSIAEIISEECYINVDFEDVKTILKDSGTAIISTAYGEGEHRISDAIHNALHSPLLKKHDINTSKRLLFKFSCWKDSPNALKMAEIDEITQFTTNLPKTIDVKWGIADNPEMGDRVKITVLASGFDVNLEDNGNDSGSKDKKVIFGTSADDAGKAKEEQAKDRERMIEVYGAEKVTQWQRDATKNRYAVLKPSQFDNHEVIALLEHTPAYNRDPRFNEELHRIAQGLPNDDRPTEETHENGDVITF